MGTAPALPCPALDLEKSLHQHRAGAAIISTSICTPTCIPEQQREEERQRGAGRSHVAKWVTWTGKDHSVFAEQLLRVCLTQSADCGSRAVVFRLIKKRGSCLLSHLENFFCLFIIIIIYESWQSNYSRGVRSPAPTNGPGNAARKQGEEAFLPEAGCAG